MRLRALRTEPAVHSGSALSLTDRPSALPAVNGLAFALLLAVVALAPFPYGAVTPRGSMLLETAAFGVGILTFASMPRQWRLGAASIPLLCLVLISILGALQLVPLPLATLRTVAPLSASVYSDANEILRLFGRRGIAPKISIAPWDTRVTILLTLAYAVLFACAAMLCHSRLRRRIAVGVFLASATIHILYSTATTGAEERLHGTFINPNHFAGYIEIGLPFAFALVLREVLHSRERAKGARDIGERLEKRALPLVAPVLLLGVMAAGIGLTRSRGGILAAILTTFILIAIAPLHRARGDRHRVMRLGLAAAVLAGIAFVAFSIGNTPILRFLTDPHDIGSDERTALWRASIDAWRLSPTFGAGLGAFREAFRRTQPASVEGLVEQAHNDFLQMLVTGGWIGAALVAIAFASMLLLLVRAWRRQEHREESAFALAGIGALVALVLHGAVEFNMSIPAIPATLAIMTGMAWASATANGEQRTRSKPRPVPRIPS